MVTLAKYRLGLAEAMKLPDDFWLCRRREPHLGAPVTVRPARQVPIQAAAPAVSCPSEAPGEVVVYESIEEARAALAKGARSTTLKNVRGAALLLAASIMLRAL